MRHGMEWRRFGRFLGVGVGCAALTVLAVAFAKDKITSARQAALVEELKSEMVFDLEGLAGRLTEVQAELMPILPPEPTLRIHQPVGLFAFDPTGFPKDFLAGLVYDVEHGCPVYTVTVQEDSLTGEILFYNGDDKPISSLPPVQDYDIMWLFARFHPSLYTRQAVDEQTAWLMSLFDPLRLEVELKLLPADYIEAYAANALASLPVASDNVFVTKGGGAQSKMMRLPSASTSIVFAAMTKVTNGVRMFIQYPDDFTNRLEIFSSTNLLDNVWSLAATNLLTTGTNEISWLDTAASNRLIQFYLACNADTDSDEDGLVDGREQFMYRTCATNIDTDEDGLVDGFSGLVSTNNYPGGVATNGGIYVEGEMTWTTAPTVFDTDADAMGDGWEVAHGHNPADENDPPNVSGTIFYTGRQTGTVHVVAVTSSSSWSTNASCTVAVSNIYLIPHLEQTNYWLKAWMDTEVDGLTNATEAKGVYTNASIIITNRMTGKDIVLFDPDNDSDGVPDWWEVVYFGSITNQATDPDGDNYSNQEEYDAGTDPTNTLNHPWNLGGTITYTGPQTGTVWVAACTDGTTWNWAQVATNAQPGTYTITHLPPNTNYWVRAWRDTNGDGVPPSGATSWEAWGSYNGNPIMLDANVAEINITLTDPDNDADGLPDWWEVRYGLDPTSGGAGAAGAWWKLDETTGTNAADSAGTNHGLLHGFATTGWVAGVVGNGLTFDGSNTYVEMPDSLSIKPVNQSIGLWIKPAMTYTNGRSATFLSKEVGSKGYSMCYENGGLVFRFQSSGAREVMWPCALTAGVPVHVVGTYDGAWQRLYVDAQLKTETNYNWETGFGNISQGTNVLRLGATVTGVASNHFAGILDDVRITGEEWSTTQIHAVWELGSDPDGDGLSNYQEFDYGTNPTNSDTDGDGLSDGAEVRTPRRINGYLVDTAPSAWLELPLDAVSLRSMLTESDEDDGAALVSLGFAFPFYGTNCDEAEIGVNGLIEFGVAVDGWSPYENESLPSLFPTPLIAAYWDDLCVFPEGADILCANVSSGTSSVFVVEWRDVALVNDPDNTHMTFQAVLEPSGIIRVNYQTLTGPDTDGSDATFGLQDDKGAAVCQYAYAQQGCVSNGLSLVYTPQWGFTDPNAADTDGDFMPDGWEVEHGLDPLDPSDQWTSDVDEDGMPDAWEFKNGFDPLDPADAAEDQDEDGLNNLQEYLYGTDPRVADTDNDEVNDGDEAIRDRTDPTDPDRSIPLVNIIIPANGARKVVLP